MGCLHAGSADDGACWWEKEISCSENPDPVRLRHGPKPAARYRAFDQESRSSRSRSRAIRTDAEDSRSSVTSNRRPAFLTLHIFGVS